MNLDLGYRFVDGLYAPIIQLLIQITQPDNDENVKLPSYGLLDLGTTLQIAENPSLRINVNQLVRYCLYPRI